MVHNGTELDILLQQTGSEVKGDKAMDEKRMTVEEVLEITARQLGGIMIPAELADQIGIPIKRAMGNIQAVLQAIQRNKEEEKDGGKADTE